MKTAMYLRNYSLPKLGTVLSLLAAATSSVLLGQIITFEPDAQNLLPDGSAAADDLEISDQFAVFGLTFGIDNNLDGVPDPGLFPHLERIGHDGTDAYAYGGANPTDEDVASPGFEAQLGQYILRASSLGSSSSNVLLISYSYPETTASGEIWDIDGYPGSSEQVRIEALDKNGKIIKSVSSPEKEDQELDGKPWSFEIAVDLGHAIHALRIVYTGTKPAVPIAFNNFSPSRLLPSGNQATLEISPAVEIAWNSQAGIFYQIQWTDDLSSEDWHNFGAPIRGNGVQLRVFDSTRNSSRRFYRVQELE